MVGFFSPHVSCLDVASTSVTFQPSPPVFDFSDGDIKANDDSYFIPFCARVYNQVVARVLKSSHWYLDRTEPDHWR
jgi:hypothetical protein